MVTLATQNQRATTPSSPEQVTLDRSAPSLPTMSGARADFLLERNAHPTIAELYNNAATSSLSGLRSLEPEQKRELNRIINEINQSERLSPEVRREITKQLVRDLTHPEEINQGVHATCASSAVQTDMLARQRPLEYARMVSDLATKGECSFNDPSRTRVKLDDAALERDVLHVPKPYEARNITERMIQNVCVKYAIGQTVEAGSRAPLIYDQKTDTITGTYQNQSVNFRGLFDDQVAHLHQGVTGMKCDAIYTQTDYARAHTAIREQLAQDKGVLVQMNWASSGIHQSHALVVQKIDDKNGLVYFYNPHGATNPPPQPGAIQTLSVKEFHERLTCAFVETKDTNDGKVSVVPPPYSAIEQAANRDGRKADEPIMVHVAPPQAANTNQNSSSPQSTTPPPNFRVVEPEIERSRNTRSDRTTPDASERAAGRVLEKREQPTARTGYRIPGKDEDLLF